MQTTPSTFASPIDDFAYGCADDDGRNAARVAIFAEDESLRRQMGEDLQGAGFRAIDGGGVKALLDEPITLLGDVVVVDCAGADVSGFDPMLLSGLARLDMRVARSGAKLIVSTHLGGLDDVFAVLDQSNPQILVDPSRAERVVAVGRVMGEAGAARVREMGDEDRVALLRLSQQVEAIAHSLDRFSHAPAARPAPLSEFRQDYRGPDAAPSQGFAAPPAAGHGSAGAQVADGTPGAPVTQGAPTLPDAQVLRQIIANRQARARFFEAGLFGDPAWDMLLDLTAAHAENARVSITSLCIAAGVPATTALRWLTQMVESGIFVRVPDPADRRRAFIGLSDTAVIAMSAYFASLRTSLLQAA